MRIRKIELLSDYKCFKKGTVFDFYDTPIICIIGKNSTGKTIFLEMLYNIINTINCIKPLMDFNQNKFINNVLRDKFLENKFVQNFNWKIEVAYEKNYICEFLNNYSEFSYLVKNGFDSGFNKINVVFNNYCFNNSFKNSSIFHKALKYINLKYDNSLLNSYKRGELKLKYFSLSAGEKSIIDVFSLFTEKNTFSLQEECLYLLDEPDKYLNNELKRKYISLLQEAISENDQIIFTTHSTELISDLQEIQVYKCENFEIKNINFNPFGEDSSVLTEKLFDDKFTISDIAKNTYDNYREKIKSASIGKLDQLKSEIKAIFSDNIYRKELLKLINDRLSLLNR